MAEEHPADDVMAMAYRAIQPWMGLNDKMAAHDCATAVAKVIIEYGDQRAREARAAGIEAAARLCDDAAAQAKDLRDQQERRTWSQAVDRNITRLGVRIVAATELGRSIRGLAGASPQSEADRLERDHILYAEGRAAGLEAAAHAADQYIEHPTSGQHNNTQAAFDQGMDHYAGCVDSALAIAQAIRALATTQGGEG